MEEMTCPQCSGIIDVDEEDLDEGDPVSCDECGADLRVASLNPVELEIATAQEDDEAEEFDEDLDEEDDDLIEEAESHEEDDRWS